MVILQRWPVSWRENDHVTEDVTNGGRKVMSEEVSLMEGE